MPRARCVSVLAVGSEREPFSVDEFALRKVSATKTIVAAPHCLHRRFCAR